METVYSAEAIPKALFIGRCYLFTRTLSANSVLTESTGSQGDAYSPDYTQLRRKEGELFTRYRNDKAHRIYGLTIIGSSTAKKFRTMVQEWVPDSLSM